MLKKMTKVQRQCFAFLSGSAANTIVVENLGQDRASLKTQEVLEPGQPPRYYLPRDSSWALEDVSDGMFITIGGLLQTIGELVPTSEGDVQAIALSDGDVSLQNIKLWKLWRKSSRRLRKGKWWSWRPSGAVWTKTAVV